MKFTTKLLSLALALFSAVSGFAQGSENYSVIIQANASSDGKKITLNFKPVAGATGYQLFRKEFGAQSWGSAIATPAAKDSVYVDENITEGLLYDYSIKRLGTETAYGFVTCGAKVGLNFSTRGTILVIIEKTMSDSLADEIEQYKQDLVGDGYTVTDLVVDASTSHKTVKQKIADTYILFPDLSLISIIGHVAVPYSGVYCRDAYWVVPPDGHKAGVGDHCGAWPADVYYAVPSGLWTDTDTCLAGTRSWTINEVGDGKFDQIEIPGNVTYGLGRIDLSNMPAFGKTEVELMRQYFGKLHRYKMAVDRPIMKTIIDENFGANASEAFGSNGYRFFGAVAGINAIEQNDIITTMKDNQYIFGYGSGPGSFTSAGGIGTTNDFAANQGAAYFNMLFGSFFGDWNVSNNFLRAPLACEKGGLINAWAGRPNWEFYPMALNQSAGVCARITQNEKYNGLYQTGYFANQVHVALMGDPSLRLHAFEPPKNVNISVSNAGQTVQITWEKADNDLADGYDIYYSRNKYGPYTKANATLITTTSFTHSSPFNGKVYYMVRANRLENTFSGSFYNQSQGVMAEIDNLVNLGINPLQTQVLSLSVYPNPAENKAFVKFETTQGNASQLSVFDAKGNEVVNEIVYGNGSQIYSIDLSNFSQGLYFIKVNGLSTRLMVK
ncbi:MAG: T9SS type A sorting domain-containing protein [Flavobacteriales bacterium]|nr:T9SS type A sorting domain-containing protein [Flavobacteriales bacterium]